MQYWCVRIILHRKYPTSAIVTPLKGPPNDAHLFDDLGCYYKGLGLWIELLSPFTKIHRDDDDGMCFDILCPRSIKPLESYDWAKLKADKIASYGINAVAAPESP